MSENGYMVIALTGLTDNAKFKVAIFTNELNVNGHITNIKNILNPHLHFKGYM